MLGRGRGERGQAIGRRMAAMTFEEIAREMGSNAKAVRMAYLNGIKKIRRRPDGVARLRELVEARARLKETGL